ncbi:MAG: MBL fold metallo-hydrolase [Coriobacteriales bacterium]|jgi:glyoxylase-like metal-dependent hydrolase (beta-lactamase superfamily II)|nr:MBL fold metallo-hydrolase [Coriobacteriales bacterium]
MQIFTSDSFSLYEVGGAPGGEAYLLVSPEGTLLIDSGFAFSALALIANIEQVVGTRNLDYLFLTHSHYDHASGSVWCKQRWPHVQIIATAYTQSVFARPGAIRAIKQLNSQVATERGIDFDDGDKLELLNVDRVVHTGDRLVLGDLAFEVYEAPGHTRCSAMLWCADEHMLCACETLGVYLTDDLVMPAFMVDYESSLAAIDLAIRLAPQRILLNHRQVIEGEKAKRFLTHARRDAVRAAQLIRQGSQNGQSQQQLTGKLKRLFYTDEARVIQPEIAFDLNIRSMVALLADAPVFID